MATLEEVIAVVKSLPNGATFWNGKEIKELPNILWEDETLEALIGGFYDGGNGVLAATNKRLIFIDKGLMWGLKVEDFPYDKISSIQYSKGLLLGEISIYTSGNKAKIDNVDKAYCAQFCEQVRARITNISKNATSSEKSQQPEPKENSQNDLIDKLKQLGELKTQGILTEEEFILAKQKLLQ